jgi:hypothetical protein
LSISPSVTYRVRRVSFDFDFNASYDFANRAAGSDAFTSIGPDVTYSFANGLEVATGYALPLSLIRDTRLFQREFFLNLGYRRP